MVKASNITIVSIVNLINTNDRAVVRGLVVLFGEQTLDEQKAEDTRHTNRRGFRADHASYGSKYAKKALRGEALTEKEVAWGRRTLVRYRWQLLIAAAKKALQTHRPELLPMWEAVRSRSVEMDCAFVLDDALQELGFPDGVNVMKFHRMPLKRVAGTA